MAKRKPADEAPNAQEPAAPKAPRIETRIIKVKTRDLAFLEKNARYMEKAQYDQLVANVKRDGKLTSLPLIARAGDHPLAKSSKPDTLEILSGNHRVHAGLDAGLDEVDAIEVTTPLTREQKIALQLSHNAITGKDDPSILADLYLSLDFDEKLYSGLTDDLLKVDDLDLSALSLRAPQYEELLLLFLPEENAIIQDLIKRFAKAKVTRTIHAASLADFDRFFETIHRTKEKLNIHNSAIALRAMAELAGQRLAQLEAEGKDDSKGSE